MPVYNFKELPIESLLPNPFRTRNPSSKDSLMRLSDSIRQYGLFTPILVGKTSAGLQIIAGERRWSAAKIAGLTTIPAMVVECSSFELMLLFWEENVQRENINLIEQAKLLGTLLGRDGITKNVVSSRLNISPERIDEIMEVLLLPSQAQSDYIRGAISDRELFEMLNDQDPVRSLHKS